MQKAQIYNNKFSRGVTENGYLASEIKNDDFDFFEEKISSNFKCVSKKVERNSVF